MPKYYTSGSIILLGLLYLDYYTWTIILAEIIHGAPKTFLKKLHTGFFYVAKIVYIYLYLITKKHNT